MKKGEKKAIQQIKKIGTANQVKSGPGVRQVRTPHGNSVAIINRTFGWDHPFAVHYYGTTNATDKSKAGFCVINPGMINGAYPKIDGKSINGDDKGIYPMLKLKNFGATDSWVAVEVTRGKDPSNLLNQQLVVVKMDVVHVQYLNDKEAVKFFGGALSYPDLPDNKTRFPLAYISTRQFGNACFQIAYFNQQYFTKPGNGGNSTRHYFLPAS
jgi:hypothetical protein